MTKILINKKITSYNATLYKTKEKSLLFSVFPWGLII
jgi:hypothetical protein